ncbi:MAG: 4-hydroxy-2-oxovalerate aldolase [Acidobacteria bacterium]|nr:4-hydroxy-2-oxovalerate aldolase [Acidobacteriota bacterium]
MPRFGVFLELPTPEPVEMAGWAGWDYCVIDCEHAPIDNAMLGHMLRGARIPAYVRVPNGEPETVQGALDNGAAGVIVPRVESVEQTRRIAQSARFFPRGRRGVNHMVRAARFSLTPVAEYLASVDRDVRVIVQIETASALHDVEAIAAVEGVDELFIGPYDLSQAMGIPGQVMDAKLLAAGERVLAAAHTNRREVSVFVNSIEAASAWIALGADALHYSADTFLLAQAMRSAREQLGRL